MAQKTIKNYFPSEKKRETSKATATKRSREASTLPQPKRKKVSAKNVLKQRADVECCSSAIDPQSRAAACVKLALQKTGSPAKCVYSPAKKDSTKGRLMGVARRKLVMDPQEGSSRVKSEQEPSTDAVGPPSLADRLPEPNTTKEERLTNYIVPPKINRFTSLEYDSPTKKKDRSSAAHEKYKSLTEPTTTELHLPYHYWSLAKKFHCTDTLVNMCQRRGETCSFSKLRTCVQQMSGKSFARLDLARMKTVYPLAFVMEQQTHIPGGYEAEVYNSYQLTVKCNMEELALEHIAVTTTAVGQGVTTLPAGCYGIQPSKVPGRLPSLSIGSLIRRRRKFRNNLVNLVKHYHNEFLSTLDPPMAPPSEIYRWHPSFRLDGVPDIVMATLPQPPATLSCSTAQHMIGALVDCSMHCTHASHCPLRVQQALESVASAASLEGVASAAPVVKEESKPVLALDEPASSNPTINAVLKGVPQSLIDKIKQKESDKAKMAMTRNHATERKLSMLSILPDICRTIKAFFIAEKRAAIPAEQVVQKIVDSNRIAYCVVEEYMALLEEVVPAWFRQVTVRKICYVKIDRKMDITTIFQTIRKKSREIS